MIPSFLCIHDIKLAPNVATLFDIIDLFGDMGCVIFYFSKEEKVVHLLVGSATLDIQLVK